MDAGAVERAGVSARKYLVAAVKYRDIHSGYLVEILKYLFDLRSIQGILTYTFRRNSMRLFVIDIIT